MAKTKYLPEPRDNQVNKVYQAEKLAEYLLIGDYWTKTLTEDETLKLIDTVITHPSVRARWGSKRVSVEFLKSKRASNAYASRAQGIIQIPSRTLNPMWVIHEVAHLLATKKTEAAHGPGFAAIERYLFTHIISESAGQVLEAAYAALGVKTDDTQIPPIKYSNARKYKYEIPGLVVGQAAGAASVLRSARDAGIFDDDMELRNAASRIARRLDNIEKHVPTTRRAMPPFPKSVVIDTGALLAARERDDVAEIVLAALRNAIDPEPIKAAPVDPRFARKGTKSGHKRRAAAAKKSDQKIKAASREAQREGQAGIRKVSTVAAKPARRRKKREEIPADSVALETTALENAVSQTAPSTSVEMPESA